MQAALKAIGGIERFVKPGNDVIVKPNICVAYHGPEYAATTNPEVVAALVSLCLGAGAGATQHAVVLSQAIAVASDDDGFPSDAAATAQSLPDDWSISRPGYEGSVWYRLVFDAPTLYAASESGLVCYDVSFQMFPVPVATYDAGERGLALAGRSGSP